MKGGRRGKKGELFFSRLIRHAESPETYGDGILFTSPPPQGKIKQGLTVIIINK